jgi:hypothetical protein
VTKLFVKAGDSLVLGAPLFTVAAYEFVQSQNDLIAALRALNTAHAQRPGHEAETGPVVDHGEAARAEGQPAAIISHAAARRWDRPVSADRPPGNEHLRWSRGRAVLADQSARQRARLDPRECSV